MVRRNAFGRQVDSFEAELDFDGFSAVRSTPSSSARRGSRRPAQRSRSSPGSPTGAAVGRIVAVRQGHLLATSFHPEITGDDRFHRLFVEQVQAATTKSSGKP